MLIKLIEKFDVAEGTISFIFEKPENFLFIPGQYCIFTLSDEMRNFSISSSDYEREIMITTRITDSNFKQNLKNMKEGDTIDIDGPYGEFTLAPDEKRTIVFLAGGIGITPFRSMVVHEKYFDFPKKIYLFYSNPSVARTAFLDELTKIKNDNFVFVPIMTQDESWMGEQNRINGDLLVKYLGSLNDCIFYIAGPPAMVHTLKSMLLDIGTDESNIISEDFIGY